MPRPSIFPRRILKRAVIGGARLFRRSGKANAPLTERNHSPAVAVDAMGGDFAPLEIVKGSVRAAKELNIPVKLVGPKDILSRELSKYDIAGLPIELVHAEDYISMEEKNPATAVRRRPNSSIMHSMKMVADGKAGAVVSAGSTGAAAASALFVLKRIPGIERPGIGALIPTAKGRCVLIDAGANVDSTPYQIAQHALMGSIFARHSIGLDEPRVGLLNIGEESSKGNLSSKNTFSILEKMNTINFVGNVEGRTLSENYCDVLVADGFVGNVFLKALEGSVKMIFHVLHDELTKSMDVKMGALMCRPAFRRLKNDKLNYAKYGGAVLLGVRGVVIIAHGISNDFAIMNAIDMASKSAQSGIVSSIESALVTDGLIANIGAVEEELVAG